MTKAEFLQGWKLLVLQDWAGRFNRIGTDGKPTPDALAQLEFYFETLSWAHPKAWLKVARAFAAGNAWPCLNDLNAALRNANGEFVQAVADHRPGVPMPPEVREMIERLGKKKGM